MAECSRTRTRIRRPTAERTDETQGRDWTVADKNYKHTRLYRVDAATGKSDLVTRADVTVHDFDLSPDSQQLVIGAATTPTIDDSFMGVRLYIVPAAGGTPEPFVKTEGKLQIPALVARRSIDRLARRDDRRRPVRRHRVRRAGPPRRAARPIAPM